MKIRSGFVSNSSSSSFICDCCGIAEEAYDGILDTGMCMCKNGHTFCNEHIIDEDFKKTVKNSIYNGKYYFTYNENEYDITEIPEEFCPICSTYRFIDTEVVLYLKKTDRYDGIINEMKSKFDTRNELDKFLKENYI